MPHFTCCHDFNDGAVRNVYEFTGFFARPDVQRPAILPSSVVWREITVPFVGDGVRMPKSDDEPVLLAAPDVEALARQLGLSAADCWIYLNYMCWGGDIDFVYGFGSHRGRPFGPVREDERSAVEAAYTGVMEQFGVPADLALQFEPFKRGYWGDD